eukprot:881020-Pelagomonas_calceolata.AAC.8
MQTGCCDFWGMDAIIVILEGHPKNRTPMNSALTIPNSCSAQADSKQELLRHLHLQPVALVQAGGHAGRRHIRGP